MELIQKYFLPAHFPMRKELAAIIVIILIFLLYPYFIRQIDITAAAIDPGVYSAVILAVSALLIFKAATWWIIKAIWPVFASYSEHHFEANFRSLTAGQKVVIYLGFYLVILFGFIEVLEAVV
ncbi:hypothetical protein [Daejeonella sp. JGW-45]|uniref:hypothetical protein n=1 Tax=Daejeonella sp. JGW-45 TaxID=3034148 RepID=UPI0023ED8C75|nr:hypothetical protein [Daejeonella sp. JGW-45]